MVAGWVPSRMVSLTTVILNVALLWPAATVTDEGTVASVVSLEERLTVTVPPVARGRITFPAFTSVPAFSFAPTGTESRRALEASTSKGLLEPMRCRPSSARRTTFDLAVEIETVPDQTPSTKGPAAEGET